MLTFGVFHFITDMTFLVSSVYKERITLGIKSNIREIVMVYIIILILHVCMCTFYYTVCIHSYLP